MSAIVIPFTRCPNCIRLRKHLHWFDYECSKCSMAKSNVKLKTDSNARKQQIKRASYFIYAVGLLYSLMIVAIVFIRYG